MKVVTDPEILAQLEGGGLKPVTDEATLRELEGGSSVAANLAAIDAQRQAEAFNEPTTFSYLFNRIKKGLAGFLGLPGDLLRLTQTTRDPRSVTPKLDAAIMAPFQTEKPVMATSEMYREAFGHDPAMKTGSDLLRYTGGVAEMAGAGGPFGLATKPAMLFPLTSSIAGSGIGMEAGGDIASGLGLSRQAGEVAGSLAGGVATAIAPNAAVAAGSAIKRRFSPSAQKATAESQAGREIAAQLESYPPAKTNIERSLEISNEIPGFNPSLPARSGAPGLLAEEKVLIAQNPNALNKAVRNVEENAKAVDDFVNIKFPSVGGETAATRVQRLQKTAMDRLEGMKAAVDDKLDDAVRVFESNPSNYENGQRLRDLFFKQKEVYAGIRSQKYQQVYEAADRLGVKASINDVKQYADDVLANELNAYQQSEIPSVFRQLAKTGGGDVSFANLHSLYKRTNADLAALRGSTAVDKDFRIMLMEGLKTRLTDKIRGFEDAGFGEVATKLKEANRFYAEEYVPRFKQGFGSDVAAKYPSGEFRTPDQLVTDLVTKPRNTQAAKDFKLLFDEVPEAHEALKNAYLDKFYQGGGAIDKNGRINQRSLDTFIRQHGETLSEFPEIKKTMQQLALDNQALLDRRAMLVAAEKKLAANDLYRLFQGRDPDVVLAEATTNRNAMRVLETVARRDPNMAKGLARGIAEHVAAQPDPAAFLATNEEAIRIGLRPLGEEHFRNLKTAVDAMTINSRNPAAMSVQASSVAPDTIAEKLGSSPRAIISHLLNIERGRTGPMQEGAAFLGRWFDKLRRDHKAAAMEAAFYDKDTARALANLVKNPQSEKAKIDFRTQMMSLGVRAEEAGQD